MGVPRGRRSGPGVYSRPVGGGSASITFLFLLNAAFRRDTTTPPILNLVCFWLRQLPLANVPATVAGLRANGAFVAIIVAESLLTILGEIVFRRGNWERHAA